MSPPPEGSRAATGIKLLDDHLHGGFSRPSTLLLFSENLSTKRVFAEHFAVAGARAGETCLYVDFFRAPQLARREFEQFGDFPSDNLVFVDATSSQLLLPSDEPYRIRDLEGLSHIASVIGSAIEAEKPGRIIVDSMEFLADRFPRHDLIEEWHHLVLVAQAVNSVICFLFTNWTYRDNDLLPIREMSDFVLEFKTAMAHGSLQSEMRLTPARGRGRRTNWIPYTFRDFAGLTVYFPRLLVTGPKGAGKTSVVQSLNDKAVDIKRAGTTVAFDYRRVNVMGIEADLFGTREHEVVESMIQLFAREVNGILLVVDAARPESLDHVRQTLEFVCSRTPCVVLANKSDLPAACSAEEIARRLRVPDEIPVVATDALTGRGVTEGFLILAEKIIGLR